MSTNVLTEVLNAAAETAESTHPQTDFRMDGGFRWNQTPSATSPSWPI